MPTSVSALSPRAHDMHKRVKQFITDHVIPQEGAIYQHMVHPDPKVRWSVIPQIEELKVSTVPSAEEPCMAKWLGVRVCAVQYMYRKTALFVCSVFGNPIFILIACSLHDVDV